MDYKKYNDFELVYMVRENDESSYRVLFQKYLPIIKHIAIGYYKDFNHYGYDLDDFIQEGYLAFHKALRSFSEKQNILFYSFVVLCVQRGLISFCRKITCDRKNLSYEYLVDCDSVPLSDSSDTEAYFVQQDLLRRLWDEVYEFPFDYVCVFELRMNQFRYKEISELLDIPVKRAHFMARMVTDKLRKIEC